MKKYFNDTTHLVCLDKPKSAKKISQILICTQNISIKLFQN